MTWSTWFLLMSFVLSSYALHVARRADRWARMAWLSINVDRIQQRAERSEDQGR
jgi:hypothetical protein